MRRHKALSGVALTALAVLTLFALTLGPLRVGPLDLAAALFGGGSPEAALALGLRLPAVATALIAGAGLAMAGAAFQTLFRNPLVAPDLLGVSSGAAAGAALALLAGGAAIAVQGAAFAGGLAAALLAIVCAGMVRSAEPRLTLVLCGVVVAALGSAVLALIVLVADPYAQLPAITYWLLGSFSRADGPEVLLAMGTAAVGGLVLLLLGFRLDALSLGDEQARALGLKARPLRLIAIAAATLVTSAAVSISGVVGWIGLLAPHAARLIVGPRSNLLLPASALIGAALAVIVGQLARAFGPAEIPVGLMAAAIGAPAFLILFVSSSRARP